MLRVDEHVWDYTGCRRPRWKPEFVDRTRVEKRRVSAWLLDLVEGRFGAACPR